MSVHSRNGKILLACAGVLIVALAVLLIAGSGDDEPSGEAQDSAAAAQDADAKAGARTLQTTLEVYATDNGGQYSGANIDALREIEPTLPANLEVLTLPDSYEVTVSSDTGTDFTINRDPDGVVTFSCEPAGEGGCSESGDW